MMVTAFLSVVAVREPDPVEYVDIECQPAAISVDCNNVQMVPLKLKALHRSGADAALLDVFWRLHVQSAGKDLGTADSPVHCPNGNTTFRLTSGAMRILLSWKRTVIVPARPFLLRRGPALCGRTRPPSRSMVTGNRCHSSIRMGNISWIRRRGLYSCG